MRCLWDTQVDIAVHETHDTGVQGSVRAELDRDTAESLADRSHGVKEGTKRILTGFQMTRKASHAKTSKAGRPEHSKGAQERPQEPDAGSFANQTPGCGFCSKSSKKSLEGLGEGRNVC